MDNRGGWGQLLVQEAAALAELDLAADDVDPPEEPPAEPDFEAEVEPDFSELDFSEPDCSELDCSELDCSELDCSELDLSDVDLLSAPVWGLSPAPDSAGGAERLSVR